MSSCLGSRKKRRDGEHEPLLPQYNDDTVLQQRLHEKLHSYQMLRAISKYYMPTNDQLIVLLRTIIAAGPLNPDDSSVSDSGRLLAKHLKQFLHAFIDFLLNKNSDNQIQDLIWCLAKSRISLDVAHLSERASKAKARADTNAAYQSLRTVGSLLFANADFRTFLGDLQTVGRQIFRDSALATSSAIEDVADEVTTNGQIQDGNVLKDVDAKGAPSKQQLSSDLQDLSSTVGQKSVEVGTEVQQSAKEHFSGSEKDVLLKRLQAAVVKLKQKPDYNDSVSTIAVLLKRYCLAYSRAAEDSLGAVQEDVHANPEVDLALQNFWSFLSAFGDKQAWEELKARVETAIDHQRRNPDFEKLVTVLANSLQKLLTDPATISHADEKFAEMRQAAKDSARDTSISEDIDGVLEQSQAVWASVLEDADVVKLVQVTFKIFGIFSPDNAIINPDLFQDLINEFGPLLIQAIQYIPIPRLEVSVPEIDLLLENLILEPGKTVNNTSFLPFRLRLETYNDVEIRKALTRTVTLAKSLFTIKIDGLSIRADDIGFWLRAHSGIFRLADEGIASFRLDDRGIDIHIDVEVGEERLEKMLTLKAVRVHIHKLSYDLRKSKFSCLAWLLKPILRPIIRKVMEKQLATAIADLFHAANRELLFARERLRATRISDPQDLATFVKAVITRLTPEEDPDLYTRVGIAQPGKGVFKGVYAPGSVVKMWNEEGSRAGEVVEEFERGGWRNDVFDVKRTVAAAEA